MMSRCIKKTNFKISYTCSKKIYYIMNLHVSNKFLSIFFFFCIFNPSWNIQCLEETFCIYMLYCNPQYKMYTWFQIISQENANLIKRSIKWKLK